MEKLLNSCYRTENRPMKNKPTALFLYCSVKIVDESQLKTLWQQYLMDDGYSFAEVNYPYLNEAFHDGLNIKYNKDITLYIKDFLLNLQNDTIVGSRRRLGKEGEKNVILFETERFILRAWERNDIDDFYEFEKIPDIGIMTGRKPVENREEAIDRLNFYINDKNKERFAIVLKKTGKVIGNICIAPDKNRGNFSAKLISYTLSKDYWNKGYMTEAVKRVIEYTFDELKIDLLTAFHYPHNLQSKRVIEKCGFEYETTIKGSQTTYNGQTFDAVVYSILKKDWEKSKITQSRCGLHCTGCEYKVTCGCGGCIATSGHPFHGECPVAKCCQEKGLPHCGECPEIPCELLTQYSCDPEHGDTPQGARIEQCKQWAKR
jgi:putative acetyltransferase